MGDRARGLARSVWEHGLKAEPWVETRVMVLEDRAEIAPMVELFLERPPRNCVFLDAALSFLPEAEWTELARHAVNVLEADPTNEVASSVVTYAALQATKTLHPHLERLFFVREYFRTYYAPYAWRGAGESAIGFLERMLGSRHGDEPERAYRCLLELRTSRAVESAVAASPRLGKDRMRERSFLQDVGLEQVGQELRFLYRPEPFHLVFAPGYLHALPDHTLADLHPTWDASDGLETIRFGGPGARECTVCGKPLHHLLRVSAAHLSGLLTGLPALTLDTCRSCLGWSVPHLWFRHDDSGACAPVPGEVRRTPEFPAEPFATTEVTVVPTGERWRWQDWALSNSRENLHRIGGHPTWIQSAEFPACPDCDRTMRFLLQLDSELDGGWLWGSGGILYVFWCDDCRVSGQTWQCT